MEVLKSGRNSLPVFVLLSAFAAAPVQAITITGSGAGYNGAMLAAQAEFTISGDFLTITLTNIATADEDINGLDTPTNTLTGLFFDVNGTPTLTTVSATVAAGSSIIGTCSVMSCVGVTDVSGEWGFSQSQDFSLTGGPSAGYGIASPGYLTTGLAGNIGNFNNGGAGTNLDDPVSLDGINFGIISAAGGYTPNGGLMADPLIMDSVVFVLSGATGLSESDFTNISFQYGTGFDEPNVVVPVPAAVWLFGSGLLGLVGVARRKQL